MSIITIILGILYSVFGIVQFSILGGNDPGPLLGLFTYGGMLVIAGAFSFKMRFAAIGGALIISSIILTKHLKNLFGVIQNQANTPATPILIIEGIVALLCAIYLVAGLKWLLNERKKILIQQQQGENS